MGFKGMKIGAIDKAISQLNQKRGLQYPAIGFLIFADIKGDGGKLRRRIYVIANSDGGVSFSDLNAATYQQSYARIKKAIES
jgi:hypothetical protein